MNITTTLTISPPARSHHGDPTKSTSFRGLITYSNGQIRQSPPTSYTQSHHGIHRRRRLRWYRRRSSASVHCQVSEEWIQTIQTSDDLYSPPPTRPNKHRRRLLNAPLNLTLRPHLTQHRPRWLHKLQRQPTTVVAHQPLPPLVLLQLCLRVWCAALRIESHWIRLVWCWCQYTSVLSLFLMSFHAIPRLINKHYRLSTAMRIFSHVSVGGHNMCYCCLSAQSTIFGYWIEYMQGIDVFSPRSIGRGVAVQSSSRTSFG
jgi:hypothetical protein